VSFAALLVYTQLGLLGGFLHTCSALIHQVGGDVWVMARGTEMVDAGEPLSAGSRAAADALPCVRRVRPLVFAWGSLRKPKGTLESIRLVGTRTEDGRLMPWNTVAGAPGDVMAPMRVSVDEVDLAKLQLPDNPIGATVEIGGLTARVAAMSRGIRSFTTLPMVFAHIDSARRMLRLPSGSVNFWVLDLEEPACSAAVIRAVEATPGLQARSRETFARETEIYWLNGSGAGVILAFVAFLGLVVGTVIVGQTLYTMVRDHHRELATLKALGASDRELIGFVAWQAGFLAAAGIAVGLGAATLIRAAGKNAGLTIVLSPWTVGVATVALLVMCTVASLLAVRRVRGLRAVEVFT